MVADDRESALRSLAKLVDCISETWNAYNDMEEPELGAVVIVLEGLQTGAAAALPSTSSSTTTTTSTTATTTAR